MLIGNQPAQARTSPRNDKYYSSPASWTLPPTSRMQKVKRQGKQKARRTQT